MPPGRSERGRSWYNCVCGHRFRSTTVEGAEHRPCPICLGPCGAGKIGPAPQGHGGYRPAWHERRDRESKLESPKGTGVDALATEVEGTVSPLPPPFISPGVPAPVEPTTRPSAISSADQPVSSPVSTADQPVSTPVSTADQPVRSSPAQLASSGLARPTISPLAPVHVAPLPQPEALSFSATVPFRESQAVVQSREALLLQAIIIAGIWRRDGRISVSLSEALRVLDATDKAYLAACIAQLAGDAPHS